MGSFGSTRPEGIEDGTCPQQERALSTVFPQKHGWYFDEESPGLKQYRLHRSGCEEVECGYSRRSQDSHPPPSGSLRKHCAISEPRQGPVVHLLTCRSWGYSKEDPFKISREAVDEVGRNFGFPSKLFEQFHVSQHLISMTHLIEYDLGTDESTTSSADRPFPRYFNLAIADFGYKDYWYLSILRHDVVLQVTTCLLIYNERPGLRDLSSHLKDNSSDMMANPITLLWVLTKQHVLSCYDLEKRSSMSWRVINELRAKLDIVPGYQSLRDARSATREANHKALNSELYDASQNAYERQAYFKASANNMRRIAQINETLHDAQRTFTTRSGLENLPCRIAYLQLDERLRIMIHDFEFRVDELTACAAILQSQFSVLYNAMNQRDNLLSFAIAETSKEIAEAMRYDGTAMKAATVAALVFLPATLVTTIFGLPVFNFEGSTRLWWVYLLLIVATTVVTLLAWFCYMLRWREKESKRLAGAGDLEAKMVRLELRLRRSQSIPLVDLNHGRV